MIFYTGKSKLLGEDIEEKMIIIYYSLSNSSCRKAIQWFKERKIEVIQKRVSQISKTDLLKALSLSENGFSDILKRISQCDSEVEQSIQEISTLSFNEAITYTLKHPEILKIPLMLDENKLVLGYNTDTIRVFIPKSHRRLEGHLGRTDSSFSPLVEKLS